MYLQLAIVYQLLEISSQFDRRCPVMREKDYISRVVCKDPSRYHCLAVDHLRLNNYRAECKDKTWVSAGYHPVLRGRYIDFEACSEDSYQPVVYWSNERYKCTFMKTNCSEIGQSSCDTDNTTTDYTCSCDTSRGYYFTSSRNKCHCNPFLEDCSCFLHPDSVLSNVNKDWTCQRDQLVTDKCKIVHFTLDLSIIKDTVNLTETLEYTTPRGGLVFYIGVKCLIGLVLLVTIVFAVITIMQPLEKTKMERRKHVPTKTALSAEPSKYSRISANTQENREIKEPTKIAKDSSTEKPAKDPNILAHSQPITDIQITSKRVSTEETGKLSKIADILILHVEENLNAVLTFESHLTKILPEGVTVKIHGPGDHCEQNTALTLQDILSRCNFLFVYLITKFSEGALSSKGYDGVDIIKNLNNRKVIKVGGVGINRHLKDNYRIQLNYAELSSEDFKRKVIDLIT